MAKTGPKPGDHEKRTKLCAFYLTPSDWRTLVDLAKKGGFKSASSLTTAIVEPIIQERLSIASAARAVHRIQGFMTARGARFDATVKMAAEGFLNLFTPPPPIVPDDDDPTKQVEQLSKLKADLRALLAELENPTETTDQP